MKEIEKLNDVLGQEAVIISKINAIQDSVDIQVFMWDLYYSAKIQAMYMSYIEQKAYNYWALTTTPSTITVFDNPAFLLSKHNEIIIKTIQQNIAVAKGVQPVDRMDVDDIGKTFLVSAFTHPIEFRQFLIPRKNSLNQDVYTLVVNIPLGSKPFNTKWSEIYARSIRVYLKGAKTNNGTVSLKVVHLGNPSFLNRNGDTVRFTHASVPIVLTSKLSNNTFVVEQIDNNIIGHADFNTYLGVSPFATWKVEIDKNSNAGLDLSLLKSVRLGFDINFIPLT